MGAARLAELAWSRRNIGRQSGANPGSHEGDLSRRTYPLMVTMHVLAIAGTAVWGSSRPSRGWLAVLLAVQPLRAWVLLTLGSRWNARGSVDTTTEVATSGPYAYVRHPNYLVVGIELLALPMAFGLRTLAAMLFAANAVLVAIRIRDEEQLLRHLPGWTEHFAAKKRFIPGIV
ncbi:MAG: isoprenylcysteine carboxylmethyltransferase family protein [Tepidiformaceae bacterium]